MTGTLERRLADFAQELDLASEQPSSAGSPRHRRPSSVQAAPSRPTWRRRAAALVAVAAAVIAVAVTVQLAGDDRHTVDTDQAQPSTASPTRDLARAPGFFSTQGTPDQAVRSYLGDRLDRPAEEVTIERLTPPVAPPPPAVGYRWFVANETPSAGGTIILRRESNDWWSIIEARSTSLTIDRSAYQDGQLTVSYRGPADAALQLILQDIGDNVIARTTCTTGSCSATENVPEIPILVRVQLAGESGPIAFAEYRVDPRSEDLTVTTLEPNTIELSDRAGAAAVRVLENAIGDSATILSVEAFEPFGGGPATGTVRVDTGSGASVDVDVRCLVAQPQCTVLGLSSPGFRVTEGDGAQVAVPAAGLLTITGLGPFDSDATTPPEGEQMLTDVRVEAGQVLTVHLVESSWLRMDLAADDGRILRYLRPR